MASGKHTMTLRLPADEYKKIRAIAQIHGNSITQEVIVAINEYCEKIMEDDQFKTKLKKKIRELEKLID